MVWSVCLLGEGVDGVTQRIDLLALGAMALPTYLHPPERDLIDAGQAVISSV